MIVGHKIVLSFVCAGGEQQEEGTVCGLQTIQPTKMHVGLSNRTVHRCHGSGPLSLPAVHLLASRVGVLLRRQSRSTGEKWSVYFFSYSPGAVRQTEKKWNLHQQFY